MGGTYSRDAPNGEATDEVRRLKRGNFFSTRNHSTTSSAASAQSIDPRVVPKIPFPPSELGNLNPNARVQNKTESYGEILKSLVEADDVNGFTTLVQNVDPADLGQTDMVSIQYTQNGHAKPPFISLF